MKKKNFVLLFTFLLFFSLYAGDGTYEGEDPNSDMGTETLENIVKTGNKEQSSTAEAILAERRRISALRDQLKRIRNELDAIYSAGGAHAVSGSTIQKIAKLSAELDKLQREADELQKRLEGRNADNLASSNSVKSGDPVKITRGNYEQSEIDICSVNFELLQVSRQYDSSSVIESSFGYGWSTNLDQRIILGVQPDAQSVYNSKCNLCLELEQSIEALKTEIIATYNVSSLENAENEIQARLSDCGSIESQARSIASEPKVSSLAQSVVSDAASKYAELEIILANLQTDMASLHKLESDYTNNTAERDAWYSAKLLPTLSRKNKNQRVMFPGMDASYEETGLNSLTVIDENGYPHLLYENSRDVWTNCTDKAILKCELQNNEYYVYMADGLIKKYDGCGFITAVTDRNGNSVNILRDADDRILKIQDSFGENYSLVYSGKHISNISSGRSESEKIFYKYEGNKLVSVRDAENDTVSMEYDENGRMRALHKCDGSSVRFIYGQIDYNGNILTTETINEEGYSENFIYNRNDNNTDYIDHDGNKTRYWYDANHRTVKEVRPDGTVILSSYDPQGNLSSLNENGFVTEYRYDERGNKIESIYNGGSETWTYDSYNLVTWHKDCDGLTEEFIRDDKGNLKEYKINGKTVFTQYFDSRGKVIKYISFGQNALTTFYDYDDSGNLIKESCGDISREYSYDSRNRLTKIVLNGKEITEYKYEDHKKIQKDYNGLETTYIENGRKDLVKVIQKDLLTGQIQEKRIVYDRRHLPFLVYSGNGESEKIIRSYLYTAEGKVKTEVMHGDQCWIKVYEYKNGQISSEKQFKVDTPISPVVESITSVVEPVSPVIEPVEITSYEKQINNLLADAGENVFIQKYDYKLSENNRKTVAVINGLSATTMYEYDSNGNLVSFTDANGHVTEKTYTKAGRLKSEQVSYGGWYKYSYKDGKMFESGEENGALSKIEYYPDGSLKCQTDPYNQKTYYNYDSSGRIESIVSSVKKTCYEYDDFNRIVKESVKNTAENNDAVYYVTYNYSEDGRNVTVIEGGKYKTVNILDAFGNVLKQIDGNNNERSFVYDQQSRMIKSYDAYENETQYEYNALGVMSCETSPLGGSTRYEYNYMGLLEKITDDCGIVYTAVYDKAGRVIRERNRSDSEKEYEYDKAGNLLAVKSGGEIVESYDYKDSGRSVTVKDGNNENYFYSYNLFGRLHTERNRNNLEQHYEYDEEGQLKSQTNFDFSNTIIKYQNNRRNRIVHYSDGSEDLFIYDALGNVIEVKNAYGRTIYKYDQGGRLVCQKDINTGEEINFEYDNAGNRIRLFGSNRESVYTYGKNNEIKDFFDNKQRISIKLEYDKNGREVLRKFGNGTIEQTLYDKAGRVTVKVQKTERGEILWGEGYVYASDGKRIASVDYHGRVTLYEYNKKGQLKTVYYPYTQELAERLKSEAEENGLPVISEIGINKYLPVDIRAELVIHLNTMQYGLAYNLTNLQVFVEESYSYDKNENRKTKTNPFGTIEYTYDKENCLISSGSRGQVFIRYTYDRMGNLLTEDSSGKSVKYAYNSQNRLIYCEVTDKAANTYAQTSYAYDALGRRIVIQDKGEAAIRTLYDGLSFEVIKQNPVFENGLFVDINESGIKWGRTGKPTGDRYRYIADEEAKNGSRYIYLDENTYKTVNSRYRGERTQISVNGTIAAQSTSDYGAEYFSTDLLGSVRTLSSSNGTTKNSLSYDAFGSLVQGDLSGARDFGYLGKQHDPSAGLYNYGYRDYKPETARFTTSDPIRDGTNWFVYCNGDPVNFIDSTGLEYRDRYGISRSNNDSMYKLEASMNNHNTDKYLTIKDVGENNPTYQCDDYVQTILIDTGLDNNKYFAGDSQRKTVADHIQTAVENGVEKFEKMTPPELGKGEAYVVFMSDSPLEYMNHTGILRKSNNGEIYFTHNSRNNSTGGVSTKKFVNETEFQKWYDYDSFYYEKVKTK